MSRLAKGSFDAAERDVCGLILRAEPQRGLVVRPRFVQSFVPDGERAEEQMRQIAGVIVVCPRERGSEIGARPIVSLEEAYPAEMEMSDRERIVELQRTAEIGGRGVEPAVGARPLHTRAPVGRVHRAAHLANCAARDMQPRVARVERRGRRARTRPPFRTAAGRCTCWRRTANQRASKRCVRSSPRPPCFSAANSRRASFRCVDAIRLERTRSAA